MSYKVNAFLNENKTLKTYPKFLVFLPSLDTKFKVSSASFPYPTIKESSISCFGRQLKLPSAIDTTGSWTCSLIEDASLNGSLVISKLYDQIHINHNKLGDIYVFMTDQYTGINQLQTVVLKYAWLSSVTPINLDWSSVSPVEWKLTFIYNDLLYKV